MNEWQRLGRVSIQSPNDDTQYMTAVSLFLRNTTTSSSMPFCRSHPMPKRLKADAQEIASRLSEEKPCPTDIPHISRYQLIKEYGSFLQVCDSIIVRCKLKLDRINLLTGSKKEDVERFLATQGLRIVENSMRSSLLVISQDGWAKTMKDEVQLLISFCPTEKPVKMCTTATKDDNPEELDFSAGSYVLLSEELYYCTKPGGIPFSLRSLLTSALDSDTGPRVEIEQTSSSSAATSTRAKAPSALDPSKD
jgi:hypothetical protein